MSQPIPNFCPNCGKPLNGATACECGFKAEPNSLATKAQPLVLWLNLIWQRIYSVVRLQPATGDMPLPASLISMAMRALLLALLVHWLIVIAVKAAFGSFRNSLGGLQFLLGNVPTPSVGFGVFFTVLLALVAGSAAALGILYWRFGPANLPAAAALVSDSQWPVAIGALVAVVLFQIWGPLGVVTFGTGVAWGGWLLTSGMERLQPDYQQRILTHLLVVATSLLVAMIALYIGLKNLF